MPTNTPPEVESADTMAERIVSELSDDPRDEDFWTTVQGLAHAIGKRDAAVRRAALEEAAQTYDADAEEAERYRQRCVEEDDRDGVRTWAGRAIEAEANARRLRTLAEKAAP